MQAAHLQDTLETEQAKAAGLSTQYDAAAASLQQTSQQLSQLQQAHSDAQVSALCQERSGCLALAGMWVCQCMRLGRPVLGSWSLRTTQLSVLHACASSSPAAPVQALAAA